MLILDKKEYCENILKENDRKITKMDIFLLAQYFMYRNLDVEKNLKNYIMHNTKVYNQKLYDGYIEQAIKNAEKDGFSIERCIEVSQKEVDNILEINDFTTKKVISAMLLLGKFYKYCFHGDETFHGYDGLYCKSSFKDLKHIAKTSVSKNEMRKILHNLYLDGYISPLPLGGWKILIEDEEAYDNESSYKIKPDADMIYFIYKFHSLADVYECQKCHRWFAVGKRKKKVPFLYCENCRKK